MTPATNLHAQALAYHQRLPQRLWKYLNARGIPDPLIHKHLLGWNGLRITIPIPNRAGQVAFFKLAKDPKDKTGSPKMLSTPGASAELYGWEHVRVKPSMIIICEGEFDRLVLESQGFAAVTSTGGAGVFRPEWAEELKEILDVYICFDRDEAGRSGAIRVGRMIPHAKVVELPEEVGEGGDVTDFFVGLGRGRDDFLRLMERAQPVPLQGQPQPIGVHQVKLRSAADEEVEQLKTVVPIEDLVSRYVPLRRSGQNFIAHCPFHEDHNPSLVVYPQSQSFYCFGCHASGDVLNFLMKVEHLSFPEAFRVLRELAA